MRVIGVPRVALQWAGEANRAGGAGGRSAVELLVEEEEELGEAEDDAGEDGGAAHAVELQLEQLLNPSLVSLGCQ